MTIVVLSLLAVVWLAVLAPPLLRRGVETRRSDSVGDFRRHLGVLQRTGPNVIAPAHTRTARQVPPYAPGLPVSRRATPVARANRSQTLRRRRNVLLGLLATTVIFLAVGAMPGLHIVLTIATLSVLMLAGYVGMLIHMRNAAAERDMKLTFLPGAASMGPAVPTVDPGLFLRRSATN
ncbi:MAG: hypothetical protein ACYCS2_04265 [Acidimicrobiales bacterium]